MDLHLSFLSAWENFYVIVGSAGAALTGLQFVVIVLAADREAASGAAVRAFGTPTIVHFCAVLLFSAILSAPWRAMQGVALCMGACGVAGLLYVVMIFRQARLQKDYVPVLEDWLWHFMIPAGAYASVLGSALRLVRQPQSALFVIGAAAVLLLFTGIHNAWDSVVYIALERRKEK